MKNITLKISHILFMLCVCFTACETDVDATINEINIHGKKQVATDIDLVISNIHIPKQVSIGDVIDISGIIANNGTDRYQGEQIKLAIEVTPLHEARRSYIHKEPMVPAIHSLESGTSKPFSQQFQITEEQFARGQQHIIIIWPTTTINPYDENPQTFSIMVK